MLMEQQFHAYETFFFMGMEFIFMLFLRIFAET